MIKYEHKAHAVYGVIGLVGLFLFGVMMGFILNGSGHMKNATMSKSQCNDLADRIIMAARNNQPELIAELNKVYSENCVDRIFEQTKSQPKPEVKKLPELNCEAIEELLKEDLSPEDSTNAWNHQNNAKIYQRIVEQGCEKNKDKYLKLAQREMEITKALDSNGELERLEEEERIPESTCEKIEVELSRYLACRYDNSCNESRHINDAKIYANLSERGCSGNSEKYKILAKQELEIARALSDDNMEHEREATEIVETYKRLQMQAEAEKMIEKAKKITNPAIDFIIQLEKILEE